MISRAARPVLREHRREIDAWAGSIPIASIFAPIHEGVTKFMDCSLREAAACFHQALAFAVQLNYERGRMRALYHIGLVKSDFGNPASALLYLNQARELAVARQANAYASRIIQKKTEQVSRGSELVRMFEAGRVRRRTQDPDPVGNQPAPGRYWPAPREPGHLPRPDRVGTRPH